MVNNNSSKKTSSSSKKTSSSSTTTSTSKVSSTSTSSATTHSKVEKSGSQTSVQSGVHIADVTDLNRSESANSFQHQPSEYVVTAPDGTSSTSQQTKEHIIFGGTQIVEVKSTDSMAAGTSASIDLIKKEQEHEARTAHKYKGGWDGTFTYEKPKHQLSTDNFYSTTSASSSSFQKSSSSSNVYQSTTDQDGKVNVVAREWGTSNTQSSAQDFQSKSGTGIKPEVKFSESVQQDKIKYDSGKTGGDPKYERVSDKLHRDVKQSGDANPTEYLKEHSEHVKFDNKSGKYITDTASRENRNILDKNSKIIDSVTLQQEHVQDATEVINVIKDLSQRDSNHGRIADSQNFAHNSLIQSGTSTSNITSSSTTQQKSISSTSESTSSSTFLHQENVFVDGSPSKNINNQSGSPSKLVQDSVNNKKQTTSSSNLASNISSTSSSNNVRDGSTLDTAQSKNVTNHGISDLKLLAGQSNVQSSFVSSSEVISKSSATTSSSTIVGGETSSKTISSSDKQQSNNQITNVINDGVATGSNRSNISTTHTHSSNLIDNGVASGKNVKDTTTTYTSKVYDDKTKTWKIIDEATISEKDFNSGTHNVSSKVITQPSSSNVRHSTNVLSTDKNKSSKTDLSSSISKLIDSKTRTQITQMYDENTKTWKEVDEKTIKAKRPSLTRYVSKESDGTFTATYKKKIFNSRTGKWVVVDEKIYKNKNINDHIPDIIDDVTNLTTTTYSTKIFDSKTGQWKVVEEKSFSDTKTFVPKDIVEEIEKDHADVANITTTTEITKVRQKPF